MSNTSLENRQVSRKTLEKRLRRYLAKTDFTLHRTRSGSAERRLHGEYLIRDELGHVYAEKISLEARLRSYALMAEGEVLS